MYITVYKILDYHMHKVLLAFRKFLAVIGNRLRCPLALIQHDARHPNELGALPKRKNDDQINSGRQNIATTILAISLFIQRQFVKFKNRSIKHD